MSDIIKIKKNVEINFDKPIACKDDKGHFYLLLPQQKHDGYEVMGYNWLNLETLEWNSCVCWKTKEEAITSYNYKDCFNVEIEL